MGLTSWIRSLSEAGVEISDKQISSIATYLDETEERVRDALRRYKTIKIQAERIAYLESRVMDLKEEVRKARQR